MRKIFFAVAFLALCGLMLPVDAASRRARSRAARAQAETPVIQISDEEVLRHLDEADLAKWNEAQQQLKKAANDMRSAQWLLDRSEGSGSVKLDVSGAHEAGANQMKQAQALKSEAEKTLAQLREKAQQKIAEIALLGPQYEYLKSDIQAAELSAFCAENAGALVESLHAQNYYALYFAGAVKWTGSEYVADKAVNDMLLPPMIAADGTNYSIVICKGFTREPSGKGVALKPTGFDMPDTKVKAAIIVAETIERKDAPALLSLRACDFQTWKIIEERTCQLASPEGAKKLELSFADKAKFADALEAAPDNFLFQISLSNPKNQVSRECALLIKHSLLDIEGANITDGDFFISAYPAAAGQQVPDFPESVNAVWSLNPTVPPPPKTVEQQEKEEPKKQTRRRTSRRSVQPAEEQAAPVKKVPENAPKGLVLLKTPLNAYNPALQSSVDVGEFIVSLEPDRPVESAADKKDSPAKE